MNIIEATVITPNASIAIVIARFNKFINKSLLNGAIDTLKRIGQIKDENITIIWIPGTYELPLITSMLARTKKYNAIVALGTIIRGNTAHFECIVNSVSTSLVRIMQEMKIPIAFGVLTTETIEQAIERAGTKVGNKGSEAALTALEMINILQAIEKLKFYKEDI